MLNSSDLLKTSRPMSSPSIEVAGLEARIARLPIEQRKKYDLLKPDEQQIFWKLNSKKWRLSNLYWVTDKNGKKVKFFPNWAQRQFYRNFWYLNVVLKVRQIGMSTFMGLLQLDDCLHRKDYTCGIVDKTVDDAKKKLVKIKYAYDHLDDPDDPATAPLGALIKQAVGIRSSNKTELSFTNNSQIWAGASLRGGTVNNLHVSELGPIAFSDPKRAAEIAKGSFNTVHQGNIITIESTHEGGRYGLNYEMIRAAEGTEGKVRSKLDWRLNFFPWWREPGYRLALVKPLVLTTGQKYYFGEIERMFKVKLTDEQKFWWQTMKNRPGQDMEREFPGHVEEALQALTPGAIYGPQLQELRARGRVREFEIEGFAPLFTSWDIGVSDFCCIWLLQMVGYDILCHGYLTFHGERPAYYAAKMIEWEREFDRPIVKHFIPHDAANVIKLAGENPGGKSWQMMLRDAGLRNTVVVPRTPDLWVGINYTRSLLPRFFFHSVRCEKEIIMPDKTILPSGLSCLAGYHKTVELVGGRMSELPVHDASSHGADALRTFGEAHSRGMIDKVTAGAAARGTTKQQRPQSITGIRQQTVVHERVDDRLRPSVPQTAKMGFRP